MEDIMKITLKDGSVKEYAQAMSIYDIALDISEGLARVACAGINIVAKRPDHFIKGVLYAAMVETYAVFAVLISLMLVLFFQA